MQPFFSWLSSRRIQYLAGGLALFFALFLLLRILFYFGFSGIPGQTSVSTSDILNTFSIGLRFDLRVAILLMLIPALLLALPWFNALNTQWLRNAMRLYLVIAISSMLLVAIFDFGHYLYLGTRLNATVFRFLGDADISTDMLWQSYPVIWISLGVVFSAIVFTWLFIQLEKATLNRNKAVIRWHARALAVVILLPLIFLSIIGRISNVNLGNPVPLRWSDAYYTGDARVSALGLNPVIFLYETARARHDRYDIKEVREYYDLIANYLGVTHKNQDALNFDRIVPLQAHRIVAEQKT